MDLEKIKKVLPDFQMCDFNMFDTVTHLEWKSIFDYGACQDLKNIFLTMSSGGSYEIQMEFVDVSSLCFQGSGQVAGFYIKDMADRGYESSSHYEVGDYEEGCLKFYCSDIRIISFVERQG